MTVTDYNWKQYKNNYFIFNYVYIYILFRFLHEVNLVPVDSKLGYQIP